MRLQEYIAAAQEGTFVPDRENDELTQALGVGAGFPGHKSQQMTLVTSPAPGLLFAGGHFLDTAFQAITTY